MAFGNYNPLKGAARVLVVTCDGSGILTVALGVG